MSVLIKRLRLLNYKSIRSCDVSFSDVTFLAGPNGAGKSNFIDALAFLRAATSSNLEGAVRSRGGFDRIAYAGGSIRNDVGISVDIALTENRTAFYGIHLRRTHRNEAQVHREMARIVGDDGSVVEYDIHDGSITSSNNLISSAKIVSKENLFISLASSILDFSSIAGALGELYDYSITPMAVRSPDPVFGEKYALDDAGFELERVLEELSVEAPSVFERINQYVAAISPGYVRAQIGKYGPRKVFEVIERLQNDQEIIFSIDDVSEGTLRALGNVTALLQVQDLSPGLSPLVMVEEPENGIHPGAAATVLDAIFEASAQKQIIATTHSPDLLDHPRVQADNILAASKCNGETIVDRVDDANREALREHLMTAGEMLRANQIYPEDRRRTSLTEDDLFRIS